MRPLKIKVSITLDDELVASIKELAERDERSFSQYINMVLKKWVAEPRRPGDKEITEGK